MSEKIATAAIAATTTKAVSAEAATSSDGRWLPLCKAMQRHCEPYFSCVTMWASYNENRNGSKLSSSKSLSR